MTILDPCMSLEWIRKYLVVSGVVDMRQILLKTIDPSLIKIVMWIF